MPREIGTMKRIHYLILILFFCLCIPFMMDPFICHAPHTYITKRWMGVLPSETIVNEKVIFRNDTDRELILNTLTFKDPDGNAVRFEKKLILPEESVIANISFRTPEFVAPHSRKHGRVTPVQREMASDAFGFYITHDFYFQIFVDYVLMYKESPIDAGH